MPNWCHNRVTISNNGENAKQFSELINKFFEEKPFQAILPQPDWKSTPNSKGELPIKQEMKNQNGEVVCVTYDFPDGKNDDRWYSWALDNWGTKWDACDLEACCSKEEALEEEYVEFTFETAWSPPQGIYEQIRDEYEDVGISWFYDEPGMEIAGYLSSE